MRFVPGALPGVIVVEPDVYCDERGFFLETYHARKYAEGGIREPFVQDNHSRSRRGTVRGLHAQCRRPQGKLVRALQGEVYDVAVDIRRGSPTFGRWTAVVLSAESFRQVYLPPGFAHGFCALSEWAEIAYKCTAPYDAADEITILWNDPDLDIEWPVGDPLLSPKDGAGWRLAELNERLPVWDRA